MTTLQATETIKSVAVQPKAIIKIRLNVKESSNQSSLEKKKELGEKEVSRRGRPRTKLTTTNNTATLLDLENKENSAPDRPVEQVNINTLKILTEQTKVKPKKSSTLNEVYSDANVDVETVEKTDDNNHNNSNNNEVAILSSTVSTVLSNVTLNAASTSTSNAASAINDAHPSSIPPKKRRGPKTTKVGPSSKKAALIPTPSTSYTSIAAVRPQSSTTLAMGNKIPTSYSASRMGFSRVPIAALSAYNAMTPLEREEERVWRQNLNDNLGGYWRDLASNRIEIKGRPRSCTELATQVLPYWLMLAAVDVAIFGNRTGANLRPNPPSPLEIREARERKWAEEYQKLHGKLTEINQQLLQKPIPTELSLLEQKLCLEEEKFLFAKLKTEYNAKVIEIMARRRRAAQLDQSKAPSLTGSKTLVTTSLSNNLAGSAVDDDDKPNSEAAKTNDSGK